MISIKRILVPTDFSDQGRKALAYGVAFADQFGAAVDLMHGIEPPTGGARAGYISKDELRKSAENHMEALHSEWEEYAFPVSKVIVDGYPFVEIVKQARESDADLIVIGTHGRGAIAHMLLGSVAERVVRKAPCPVLTVRDSEHEFVHP